MTPDSAARQEVLVKAYDRASSYNLERAREILQIKLGQNTALKDPLLIAGRQENQWVGVADHGSIVFFNFSREEQNGLCELLRPAEVGPNGKISSDDFKVIITDKPRPIEDTEELEVKEFNRDIALLVTIVLSRTVSLEYYEDKAREALNELKRSADLLAGHLPWFLTKRKINRRLSNALAMDLEMIDALAIFDEPDDIWDKPRPMHKSYESVRDEFELEERISDLKEKTEKISRLCDFVRHRLSERQSYLMEWVVIIILVLELWREFAK